MGGRAKVKGKLTEGPIRALGAMAGPSLRAVRAAEVLTDGIDIMGFGEGGVRPYSDAERAVLRAALGRWPGDDLAAAARVLQDAHLDVLRRFPDVALVGVHGLTLAHDPQGRGTHQLGDGQALAEALDTPVVWDFRAADVALGGTGTPLAPFFHHACARWTGITRPVAFLDLGDRGTLSWVDPAVADPAADGAALAFDTGPANGPLDALAVERLGQACDRDGALARRGRVEDGALELFLSDPYFRRMPPKSLAQDDFATMLDLVGELGDADAAATMTAMAATAVVLGMEHCPSPPNRVLVTGGGRHNPVMMRMIAAGLDCPVAPVESLGLDGDMLDAQAFAYLAVRVARGMPTSAPGTTGVMMPVGGGQVSVPG